MKRKNVFSRLYKKNARLHFHLFHLQMKQSGLGTQANVDKGKIVTD